jgi:hypothetical protein
VGGKFSVDLPASVTFDMILINVADRRLLWEGHFNETQKSLFENLFDFGTFWKRKGKWLTVRELADTGLEKVLQTFPAP